ncbi:GDCCVxC domain-containing (seleno)protein [Mesorhizobium neociceri]|uniref:GDCCVxC domain-containing (seleno)protein n=1 Tax=Mesorhizobium neociceri TaxID=1307853 RepID=UPI001F47877F|nr:GDCCVxC domain-containing (seleno)protein [Mesorhizobium neociceri]
MTQLTSTLTCPNCGHQASETMPVDACQFFYECRRCGTLLRLKAGYCCVFCSYGDVPCPPVQEARAGGPPASCGGKDCQG